MTTSGKLKDWESLFEIKSTKGVLKEDAVTEADKLNGIEWQGKFTIPVKLYRPCRINLGGLKVTPEEMEWTEWVEEDLTGMLGAPLFQVYITKKNGKWEVEGPKCSKLDCSALPKRFRK